MWEQRGSGQQRDTHRHRGDASPESKDADDDHDEYDGPDQRSRAREKAVRDVAKLLPDDFIRDEEDALPKGHVVRPDKR